MAIDSNYEIKSKILNLSVKKFRSIMEEKHWDVKVFRLVPKTKFETKCGMAEEISIYSNLGLREILKFSTVFREKLPPDHRPKEQ